MSFAECASFFWYSSASMHNQKGSLMHYALRDGHVAMWYASMGVKDDAWYLEEACGVERSRLESILGLRSLR